jgi:hypothetical protein
MKDFTLKNHALHMAIKRRVKIIVVNGNQVLVIVRKKVVVVVVLNKFVKPLEK